MPFDNPEPQSKFRYTHHSARLAPYDNGISTAMHRYDDGSSEDGIVQPHMQGVGTYASSDHSPELNGR